MRSASSRPIASPSPKPLSSLVALPRWKRSKMCSRSSGGTPGPRSATRTITVRWSRGGADLDRLAGAARSAARCRSGCARPARRPPGRRAPSTGPAESTSSATSRSAACSSNSAATARAISPSSTGSERSWTAASRRERSSSSLAQHGSRRSSRAGARDLLLRVLEVAAVAQVLVEQLHRALEHRQRRAQLVRGGGDERAPRRLLAAQLLLHAARTRAPGRRPRRGRGRSGRAPPGPRR